jgi:hypothetical protein
VKRIAGYIFALLIILSLAGCGETKSLLDSDVNPTASSKVNITASPNANPTASPDATAAPETTATPTPRVFDTDNVPMQSTPDSTCFSEVGYDSDWEVLVVRFRDSGSVYTYSDFPEDEWNEFIAADSLGSWYNTYIKGQYECEKIG